MKKLLMAAMLLCSFFMVWPLSISYAWETDIIGDLDQLGARYMVGVTKDGDAEGGSASIISGPFAWASHKNLKVFEIVADVGMGTRFGDTNATETAKLTGHIGPGACFFQVVCASFSWVVPDKEWRANYSVDLPALVRNLGKVVDKTVGTDVMK